MEKKYLEAGKVNNIHALSGEVKFEHWCENDKTFKKLKNLYLSEKGDKKLEIKSVRGSNGRLIVSFSGIETPEDAGKLKGKVLFASRSELDPQDKKVFIAELIGEDMTDDKTGKVLGKIVGTDPRGRNGLYIVKLENGEERYFPMEKEFIVSVDRNCGVRVNPPEGIFD